MKASKDKQKKDKKHSKSRDKDDKKDKGKKADKDDKELDLSNQKDKQSALDEKMNRARVNLDSVDNTQTYEHPATFYAEMGRLNT